MLSLMLSYGISGTTCPGARVARSPKTPARFCWYIPHSEAFFVPVHLHLISCMGWDPRSWVNCDPPPPPPFSITRDRNAYHAHPPPPCYTKLFIPIAAFVINLTPPTAERAISFACKFLVEWRAASPSPSPLFIKLFPCDNSGDGGDIPEV